MEILILKLMINKNNSPENKCGKRKKNLEESRESKCAAENTWFKLKTGFILRLYYQSD